MITIRSIASEELDAWLALSGKGRHDDLLAKRMRSAWESGLAGPSLTFVAEEDGRPVGRLAYIPASAASSIPDVHEATIAGLWLDPTIDDPVGAGATLLRDTLPDLPGSVVAVDGYANPEYMPDADLRRDVFAAAGMPLFQEKEGFVWTPESPASPNVPHRLGFRSILEAGPEPFAAIMSRCVVGTLDRQDRYYAALVGPDDWGREMLTYLTDADAPSWLMATDPTGAAVGYVLLGDFDESRRGTIIHIGVAPDARGQGYVNELLWACNEAALRRGFDRVLSDVDVENPPMLAAMERAGHHAAATPWHVFHHRLDLRGT